MEERSQLAELSGNAIQLILSAYENGESLDAPLDFRGAKQNKPVGLDAMLPSDELQVKGFLINVSEGVGFLSDKAKEAMRRFRERLGTLSLDDSRVKHALVTVYVSEMERGRNEYPDFALEEEANLRDEDGKRGTKILRLLMLEGHLRRSSPGGISLTDKGREVAKRFYKEAKAKQRPQEDKLSIRFTYRKAEAERFMRWAWKQNRGDLRKPVDARAFAIEHKRSIYDLKAILEWTTEEGYTKVDDNCRFINKHALEYWDAPLNLTFPHEYQVYLTPKGETFGGTLHAEYRGRFKRWSKTVAEWFSHAKAITTAVGTIAGIFGGYWAGYYHRGAISSPPQPSTQAVSPSTKQSTTLPTDHP